MLCHSRSGGGKSLLLAVNEVIRERNSIGILFCKDGLLGFYRKYGWTLIPESNVILEPFHGSVNTMVYKCNQVNRLEYRDRFI